MIDRRDDTGDIKQGLKDRILPLCQSLLADGRQQGRLWVAHNPVTGDYSQTAEFKVALDRDRGAWIDWRTGEKGDVIKLIQYCRQLDFREAMDWARDFLGIRNMSREDRDRFAHRAAEARRKAEEDAETKRLKRMQYAERLFNTGYMDGARSAAEMHAQAYFAARGIPLEQIPNRDLATFRFAPGAEFWQRAETKYENGRLVKLKDGPKFPAILSAIRQATGQISAVHCTFLSPLGPKKLPVSENENAKLIRGEQKGGVIRISHGPEGLPPELAVQAHPCILGEGIETVASVAIAAPEARAWAAGSLSNMANAPLNLPCVSAGIILRDKFKNSTTQKQFERVMEALSQHGKPLAVIESHIGNDFNDLMMGED